MAGFQRERSCWSKGTKIQIQEKTSKTQPIEEIGQIITDFVLHLCVCKREFIGMR